MDIRREMSQSQQVAGFIRKQILDGQLLPGQRIETVRVLADKMSVGRQVIQSAFEILAGEDLLYKKVGSGTFVNADCSKLKKHLRLGFYIHGEGLEKKYNQEIFNICTRQGAILGHDVILIPNQYNADDANWGKNFDAFIMTGQVDDKIVRQFKDAGKLVLVVGHYDLNEEVNNVFSYDFDNTIRILSEKARENFNTSRFAFILGQHNLFSTRIIERDIKRYIKDENLPMSEEYFKFPDDEDGYKAFKELMQLDKASRPDVVFVIGQCYPGVAKYIFKHNLSRHERPKIILNQTSEELIYPELPDILVHSDKSKLATAVFDFLSYIINNKDTYRKIKIETELIISVKQKNVENKEKLKIA